MSPPIILLHPAHVADPMLLKDIQSPYVEVRVMERVNGPAVPLEDWLKAHPHLCPTCSQPLGEDRATIAQGRHRGQYHPRCLPCLT